MTSCPDCRRFWVLLADTAPEVLFQLLREGVSDDRLMELRAMPYQEYLRTDEWGLRRRAALVMFGGKCAVCASTESPNCHHRSYERRGEELPEDVVVLCREHHVLYHGEELEVCGNCHWFRRLAPDVTVGICNKRSGVTGAYSADSERLACAHYAAMNTRLESNRA